ncbi:MAG: helix-turn-helix domain-containing protein [Erysipelotrichaceae bacterium]
MDQQKIGRFLKELRNQKGMTQEQLGAQLLVTNKTISRWETGDYMVPVDQLIVLSQLYDVNINELLQGERIQADELDQRSADNIVHALETVAQQQGINNHNTKVKHSLFAFNILLLCSLWVVSMFERQLSNYGLYPIVGYSIHELFSLIPFLCIGVTVCYLIVFFTK